MKIEEKSSIKLDEILNQDENEEVIFEDKPDFRNAASPFLLLAIFVITTVSLSKNVIVIAVFSLIFLILLIFLYLYIKSHSVILNKKRILEKSGIFYKKQISIILEKFDHSEVNQGFSNKIFKNGNVKIFTTGSNKAELVLSSLPKYRKLYEILNS